MLPRPESRKIGRVSSGFAEQISTRTTIPAARKRRCNRGWSTLATPSPLNRTPRSAIRTYSAAYSSPRSTTGTNVVLFVSRSGRNRGTIGVAGSWCAPRDDPARHRYPAQVGVGSRARDILMQMSLTGLRAPVDGLTHFYRIFIAGFLNDR